MPKEFVEKSTDGADDGENSHSFEELQVQYLYQVMHQNNSIQIWMNLQVKRSNSITKRIKNLW